MSLYWLFLNGILKELRDLNTGCTMDSIVTGGVCKAHDPAVACLYEACMQRTLDVTFAHCCCWRYNHNPTKSMCATFGQQLQPYNTCSVHIGRAPIPKVSISIHVGVALCNRDSHEAVENTDSMIRRGKRYFFPMLSLVKLGQTLNPVIASTVYWDVIMSTMIYGIEVWDTSQKDVKYHKDMTSIIPGLPWGIAHDGMLIFLGCSSVKVKV